MNLSAKGAEFIRHHEGFVSKAYRDPVNVLTIGIGFTWRSGAFRKWWAQNRKGQKFTAASSMTRQEAEAALRFLCDDEYGAAVEAFLGKDVPQHVYDGMVSPVFNLGPGSLDWKWAAACKRGDYTEAAGLLKHTGTTAGGRRLNGLVKRRLEEAELISQGDYAIGRPTAAPLEDGMLIRGERGDEVETLQRDLDKLGHYEGAIDGIFGPGTESAVMAFQRAQALADDGYAGPATLAALKDAVTAEDTEATKGPPEPVSPPQPQPRPQEPQVEIGASGYPVYTPKPGENIVAKPSPVQQVSKALGGAKGSAQGLSFAGGLVILLAYAGIIPPGTGPTEMALISTAATAVVTPLWSFVQGYLSPRNAE